MKNKYLVKCSECRKTIKKNASFAESVQGDKCKSCRAEIKKSNEEFMRMMRRRK